MLHLPDSVTGTKSVVGGAVVVRGASPGAYGDGDGGGGDGCGDGGGGDGGGGGAGDGDSGGGGDGDTRSLLQIGTWSAVGANQSLGPRFQKTKQPKASPHTLKHRLGLSKESGGKYSNMSYPMASWYASHSASDSTSM